ncbi:DUF7522 family protein [Haloarchaeobius sp. TZWWS8]|uniref:DUF7522 family protein n=1 Tax=Haloarchaeobius sp. TZWWS8 TaxID=3446121 RepID=UPI003EBB8AAC
MTSIAPPREEQLVAACRTGFGDVLRSVVLFTRDDWTPLYTRADLQRGDGSMQPLQAAIVDNERLGFDSQETYSSLAAKDEIAAAFGTYYLTIRAFEHGYLGRVIVGDTGVIVTTDEMDIDAFEDVAVSLRKLLE